VSSYEKIWKVVSEIPYGTVATYGQIAMLANLEGHARLVGYALHAVKSDRKLPWHRVINSQGRISLTGPTAKRQRKLLEAEGIQFSPAGRISLSTYKWKGASLASCKT
jgi:methylated-DNA-protein-cysteine methyltransferase related protein